MIRDPSDGSVKEIEHRREALQTKGFISQKPVLSTTSSGLPITNHKAEYLERLEKSRDWIRDYFNRRAEQTDSGLRSPIDGEDVPRN